MAILATTLVGRADGSSILVDQFTIPQSIEVFSDIAVIDSIDDDRLFEGGRRVQGGAGIVVEGDTGFQIEIGDGLATLSACAECTPSGTMVWPGSFNAPAFDSKHYRAIEFVVEDYVGVVRVATSLQSNIAPVGFGRVFDPLESSGVYRLEIPEGRNLAGVNALTLGARLGKGASVTFSSISIIIPEPTNASLLLASLVTGFRRLDRGWPRLA